MKVPRNLGGDELAHVLRRYGNEITRQTGSHLRLTSTLNHQRHALTSGDASQV
jgi:predicted RNA binding protein YcfA (HicA-like mRNA interferase family)